MGDVRLHVPATARNREAIAEVLEPLLPQGGLVLEIASGSGEHLCHFQQQVEASLRWCAGRAVIRIRCTIAACRLGRMISTPVEEFIATEVRGRKCRAP